MVNNVANGRPYVWLQDSVPDTPGKSKKWLSINFCNYTSPNVWFPNSPYLNPIDHYVLGAVEKDANHCASTTKAQLIDRIKSVFETLFMESVTSACSRFWGWIDAVIDANGDYFE